MKWELSELDRQSIRLFEFLDTPGDEIAPGSDKVGENFENKRIRHRDLLLGFVQRFTVQTVKNFRNHSKPSSSSKRQVV